MYERVDFSLLKPVSALSGDSKDDTHLLKGMAKEAKQFLLSFHWCNEIKEEWFGWGVGGLCAVFLFKIVQSSQKIDSQLWVIVGDLPPAYLVVDESPTPRRALENYVDLMQEWVDAVQAGKSTEDRIPVNVPPTRANAAELASRLGFIKKNFLS